MDGIQAYTEGVRIWFVADNKDDGWISGSIVSRKESGGGVVFTFDREDGKPADPITVKSDGSDAANLLPVLRNPPLLEGTDDLTNLSYLNEPSVLQNLRSRYANQEVYTYSGIVLIAMNPFARLPIYTNELIHAYHGKRKGELEPHLFAIGEEALAGMIRDQENQTVVVSGESGAGKTVSAKFIMRYFATAGETGKGGGNVNQFSEVEEKIMATNPILESFGNAKTTRNDNSSRFGKYIELHFGKNNKICGAKVRVYLLERSRLIFQPTSERNYHIYYQLCAGAPSSEREQLKLKDVSKFYFTNQGGIAKVKGMDDVEEYKLTVDAMSTVGMSVTRQWEIFRILAGLLWMGEVQITARGADKCAISDTDEGLCNVAELLHLDKANYSKWITKKQTIIRNQKIVSDLKPTDAAAVRDAVGKYIYAKLFDWLIIIINGVLFSAEKAAAGQFIGVLDIYGFEHFDKNSFEQFCINYANEKLQQEFNQRVFRMEQEEYVREKINWSYIEFSDNQACIDIVEGKIGVLSLLDEEARLPGGKDENFLNKLHSNFGVPKHEQYYKKPRFARTSFTICHYACDVTYDSEGFIDKNKDSVPDELMEVVMTSQFEFMVDMIKQAEEQAKLLAEENESAAPKAAASKFARPGAAATPKKPTLGSIFKQSLVDLMATINKTNVHYIRCIKPNEAKEAFKFEAHMVLGQLRACGVLETIKISSKGYPTKRTLGEFIDRYRLLAPTKSWRDDPRALIPLVLNAVGLTEDKYQVGNTKIFFRAGQLARMEQMRTDKLKKCVILIQKYMYGNYIRKYYAKLRECTINIQRRWRAKLELRRLRRERDQVLATKLQATWKMYKARKAFNKEVAKVVLAQAMVKGYIARQAYKTKKRDDAVICLQRHTRGFLARKQYQKTRHNVILVQSLARRRTARKEYKKLRVEAKSMSNVKYQLENKVVELTQNLQTQTAKNNEYMESIATLESRIKQWKDKCHKLEQTNVELADKMMSGTKDSSEVMQNLLHEKEALVAKVAQLAENKESLASKCNVLQDKVGNMEGELKKLREDLQKKNEEVNKMKQEGPALAKVRQEEMAAAIAAAAAHAAPPTQAAQVVAADRATDKMARRSSSLYVTTKKEGVETVVNAHVPTINEVEIAATAATTINGTSGTNGTAPTINEPQVESIVVSKPKSRRRMSSTQLQTVATDHIQKRATISAATMSPTRLRALENKSRANRISMLMRSSTATDSNREKLAAMLGSPGLEYELINGLIKNLTVPMADLNVRLAAKEILFPSHLIGLTIAQMWSYSLIEPMKKVLYGVLKTLQLQVTQFDIDYSFAFWFANVIELHSILTNVETLMSGTDSPHSTEIRRIVAEVKGELRQLAVQIATGWLKILLGRMNKLVIPGVVESQSLPGFTCTLQSSGGFFTKIMGGGQSDVTVDAVLNFLTKLWKIIQFYFIDQEIAKNIVLEILDSIGMTAFNQLLVRKNFCSWKRGMQIQYNVTRVEEWCKTHSIHQQSLNLERLMQAAKLLQLQKKTSQDVDVMFEVCYLLNPQQMKKILGIYAVSDYENPIGGEVLQEVGSRPNTTNDNGLFLEVKPRLENTAFAMGRPAVTVENYLPEWLDLPKVRLVITMS